MKKLILGALLLLSTVSFGQLDTIIIKGKVTNQSGINIPNVMVDFDIITSDYISKNFTLTDLNGEYSINLVINRDITKLIKITCKFNNYLGKQIKEIYPNHYSEVNFALTTNIPNSAGDELLLYTKHFYTGTAIVLVGNTIGLVFTSAAISNGDDPTPGLVIGSLISLMGIGFIIQAPIHIKRAGLILNENGVGIKIRL